MWKCIICGKENDDQTVICGVCGFDRTLDFSAHKTMSRISLSAVDIFKKRYVVKNIQEETKSENSDIYRVNNSSCNPSKTDNIQSSTSQTATTAAEPPKTTVSNTNTFLESTQKTVTETAVAKEKTSRKGNHILGFFSIFLSCILVVLFASLIIDICRAGFRIVTKMDISPSLAFFGVGIIVCILSKNATKRGMYKTGGFGKFMGGVSILIAIVLIIVYFVNHQL